MSDGLATIFGDLLPVLSLLLAVGLGARWWIRRNGAVAGVRVVARTGITRGTVVAVVETDGRRFLVGGGEHGLAVLADLGEGDVATAATSAEATADGGGPTIPVTAGEPVAQGLAMPGALAQRRRPGRAALPSGPRTGLVDRLRAMTVRTTMTQAGPDARTPS